MTKLQRMSERLQATVVGQTEDPEHLLDVLVAAWEEMHREASQVRAIVSRAKVVLVGGSCNVPGYRPSITVDFYDDDWRDLTLLTGRVPTSEHRSNAGPDGSALTASAPTERDA